MGRAGYVAGEPPRAGGRCTLWQWSTAALAQPIELSEHFFRPGSIPLMEHMDQHALTILVSGGQTLKLLSQRTDVSLIHSSPLGHLISLAG
jgi:hypothetical protein